MSTDTVKIKHDRAAGFCIINKEDFNADEHELFVELEADIKDAKDDKGKDAGKKTGDGVASRQKLKDK